MEKTKEQNKHSLFMQAYRTLITSLPVVMLVSSLLLVTACSGKIDRLGQVGNTPPMQPIVNPTVHPQYRPVSWPLPDPEPAPPTYANSLWQQGSRTFFRDQRASRVGDILKVIVAMKDKGKLESSTDRTLESTEQVGVGALFGLEGIIPGQGGANGTLNLESDSEDRGDGQIERKEEIDTQFAATVVQVLPNGNLVIDGRQEIRINNEIRAISVQGVVRPEDIDSSNTIDYSQIAEARISYGGRGHISEVQGPRYGSEIVDVLSPF